MVKKIFLSLVFAFGLFLSSTYADYDSYVNAENLNVRFSSSSNAKIIAIINKGYKVSVLEDLQAGWKKIELNDGRVGYVNGKYLSEELPEHIKVDGTRYYVTSNNVFLRGNDLNTKVAILDKGDELEVLNNILYRDNWINVKVISSSKNPNYVGREGYIGKKFAEKIVLEETLESYMEDEYLDDYYDYEDYFFYEDDYSEDYYDDEGYYDYGAENTELVVEELSPENLEILKADTFVKGSSDASITIFNILDTECPGCKVVHDYEIIQDIVDKSNGNINTVYVPYPLDYHENALVEATAIYCAGKLGGQDPYNEYISEIFSQSDGTQGTGFSLDKIIPVAEKLGLNTQNFEECLNDEEVVEKIYSKMDSLYEIFSIDSIPTFVILNNKTNEYVKFNFNYIYYYEDLTDRIVEGILKVFQK